MSDEGRWFGKYHGQAVLLLVLAAILCVPIPLGSNRPHAWFGFEVYVYGVLVIWALGSLCCGRSGTISTSGKRTIIVFLVWMGMLLVQTVTIPDAVVRIINPVVHSLQQELALVSIGTNSTLSVDRGNTFNEILKYGSYVGIFALILAAVTSKARLFIVIGVVVLGGVIESVFGLYSQLAGYVIFPETGAAGEPRAGTFVNRNHFSNILMMVLGVVFGVLTSIVNGRGTGALKISCYPMFIRMILLASSMAGVVMIVAVFVSGSKLPVVLFFASFTLVFLLGTLRHDRQKKGEYLLMPVALIIAVVAFLMMASDQDRSRTTNDGLSLELRNAQNVVGLKVLSNVWISGVGAGNYRWVFPMYRDENVPFATYEHAHNDYLETMIEQGVPTAAILGTGVLLIVSELLRGYKHRRNPVLRGVIFGCLVSVIFMLLHSVIEFNFRIPANAVYFFAIAAVGVAACRIDRGRWRSSATRNNVKAGDG